MNYLAHIFLAGSDPKAQLGGLLGDFVKPTVGQSFEPVIAREIRIHRLIDRFTDSHEVVLSAKARFRPSTRRFSGIILDILYDHFLACEWQTYSPENIEQFTARFYDYLLKADMPLPERLMRIAPYMAAEDWLGSYKEFSGFESAIHGVSTRLSQKGEVLIAGVDDAVANIHEFRDGFNVFFLELQAFVQRERFNLERE